jgi:4-hydroxy-3-polyprenylbenzoate decarboxylase
LDQGVADHCHAFKDFGASLSSGSCKTAGMLIAPCSIKTLSGIANSYNDELIVRSADVCLKEQATLNGAIVMPPAPALAKLSGAPTQPWPAPPPASECARVPKR